MSCARFADKFLPELTPITVILPIIGFMVNLCMLSSYILRKELRYHPLNLLLPQIIGGILNSLILLLEISRNPCVYATEMLIYFFLSEFSTIISTTWDLLLAFNLIQNLRGDWDTQRFVKVYHIVAWPTIVGLTCSFIALGVATTLDGSLYAITIATFVFLIGFVGISFLNVLAYVIIAISVIHRRYGKIKVEEDKQQSEMATKQSLYLANLSILFLIAAISLICSFFMPENLILGRVFNFVEGIAWTVCACINGIIWFWTGPFKFTRQHDEEEQSLLVISNS